MISEIQIGNFKAFRAKQTIPLRPITLVFGPNSAGKSSIIQSLLLACHIAETNEVDVHQTQLGGSSMDLGGFKRYAYKHRPLPEPMFELNFQRMEIEGDDEGDDEKGGKIYWLTTFAAFGFRFTIGRNASNNIVITSVTLVIDGLDYMRLDRDADGEFEIKKGASFASNQLRLIASKNDALLPTPARLIEELKKMRFTLRGLELNIINPLKKIVYDYTMGDQYDAYHFFLNELSEEWEKNHPQENDKKKRKIIAPGVTRDNWNYDDISAEEPVAEYADYAMALAVRYDIENLIRATNRLIKKATQSFSYLGPLRHIPPRFTTREDKDSNRTASGGDAWERLKHDKNLLQNVNRILNEVLRLRYSLESPSFALIENFALDLLVHRAMKAAKNGGGFTIGIANKLLASLDVDIDMRTELRLLVSEEGETEKSLEVSPQDVGTGISQLLPVIVNALALEQHLIAIEQPELHLHPALQADLADVLIESALGVSKNTFLIETHSEHLILRLLRRIRETAEAGATKDRIAIRPEDVAVLYVKPGREGSEVIELPVNTSGDFDVPWPDGFFAERAKELF